MAVTTIRNETPMRLTLKSISGDKMQLSPLEEKAVDEDSSFDFDDLARDGKISKGEQVPSGFSEDVATVLLGGGFWLVVIATVIVNREPWFELSAQSWPWWVWGTVLFILVLAAGIMIIRGTNSFSLVARWTMQTIALSVILAIGLGLPAATIYFFGGGAELLQSASHEPAKKDAESLATTPTEATASTEVPTPTEAAAPAEIDTPTEATAPTGSATTQDAAQYTFQLARYGRLMQLALIAIASLLPILLFFLFDRYQLGTLRKRLYINLFRLDPDLATIGEIHARYGSQIDEAYGSLNQNQGRLSPGSRWPVLVCALVITLGWIMALSPIGYEYNPQSAADVMASLAPQPTALVFGFLGVYFYSLRLIALRYARGDLKPKAYTHIMVRVFIVAVLSWVWDALVPGSGLEVLIPAFVFGILPDEFFVLLKEKYRGKINVDAVAQPPLSLNEIEGIDLYDLGRLESEGIVNVEGLAHHELIDLIIETRIPVPRLVDWVDQAILYLHLIGGADSSARIKLRDYGIRTATDLMLAWEQANVRHDESLQSLRTLLGSEGHLYRLEVIRDTLSDDEWMKEVTCWRNGRQLVEAELNAIPTSAEALASRGDRELLASRFALALKFYLESIEVRDSASVRRRIATILANSPVADLQDHGEARRHAARALELVPDDYEGLIELFNIFMTIEDIASASRVHEHALRVVESWQSSKKQRDEAERLAKLKKQLDDVGKPTDASAEPS